MTTISSNVLTSTGSVTSTVFTEAISTSLVRKPTEETTKVLASLGTDSVKLPSKSVLVPLVVPLTTTVAPINPDLSSPANILPEMVRWAKSPVVKINRAKRSARLF